MALVREHGQFGAPQPQAAPTVKVPLWHRYGTLLSLSILPALIAGAGLYFNVRWAAMVGGALILLLILVRPLANWWVRGAERRKYTRIINHNPNDGTWNAAYAVSLDPGEAGQERFARRIERDTGRTWISTKIDLKSDGSLGVIFSFV
jgi:hypothetical protein